MNSNSSNISRVLDQPHQEDSTDELPSLPPRKEIASEPAPLSSEEDSTLELAPKTVLTEKQFISVKEVTPSEELLQELGEQAIEIRKIKLLEYLIKTFTRSIALSSLVVLIAIVVPRIDKDFIKSVIPMVIGPQVTLLTGAFGGYALHSRRRKNKK